MVVIFREDTPEQLLTSLRPDVLMKGADYEKEQIIGWQFVEAYGGEIVRIPLVEGYSSTGTMNRIRAL
jgi:D-beta-D-heptose 7-phosphate kinase/D-beta-D-heptose 1-phosphate adenosyltransferase